jgi:arabinogalactan endo-1,4-beta-galactosidase
MRSMQFCALLTLFLSVSSCDKSSGGGGSGGGGGTNDPTPLPASFVKGADVSWLTEMEAAGKMFYNAAGTQLECMQLLKTLGVNSIRLRVWVNPSGGWCNTADVVAKAIRAKNLGLRIMIDFHYSDSWADPGQQTKPAAWASLDLAGLQQAVYDHTFQVLTTLKTNGVTPEWVQVGNETNDGMLWPTGKASTNMANFALLVNKGYDAVKAVDATIKLLFNFPMASTIAFTAGYSTG